MSCVFGFIPHRFKKVAPVHSNRVPLSVIQARTLQFQNMRGTSHIATKHIAIKCTVKDQIVIKCSAKKYIEIKYSVIKYIVIKCQCYQVYCYQVHYNQEISFLSG